MKGKDVWQEAKCFGSATVGSRGQVVIPANARKELGIDTGATFLVFTGSERRALVLVKADAMEQMINMVSEQLAHIEKLLKVTNGSRREVNEKES